MNTPAIRLDLLRPRLRVVPGVPDRNARHGGNRTGAKDAGNVVAKTSRTGEEHNLADEGLRRGLVDCLNARDRHELIERLGWVCLALSELAPSHIESQAARVAGSALHVAWGNTDSQMLSILKLEGQSLEAAQADAMARLEGSARVLSRLPDNPTRTQRRELALWAVHSSLSPQPEGYGNRDPRQLLDSIRIEMNPHLSRVVREKRLPFDERQLTAAAAVVEAWGARKGKWDALHQLFVVLEIHGSSKRNSRIGSSGDHPVAREYRAVVERRRRAAP